MAHERTTIDPGRMGGLPCIRDTRVTVTAVLRQLAAGRTIEEVLQDYPYIDRDDVLAALEFAAVAVQRRRADQQAGLDELVKLSEQEHGYNKTARPEPTR